MEFLIKYFAIFSEYPALVQNKAIKIKQYVYNNNNDKLGIRSLSIEDKALSLYPYLKTENVIEFNTRKIIEWSHMKNLEAEVVGKGKDNSLLSFFSTDYGVNRNKYKENKVLNIKISAFGLRLDKYDDFTRLKGKKLRSDFIGFFPTKELYGPTYYDFIGIIIDFELISLEESNYGYLMKVKLLKNENNPNLFVVDFFINAENINIAKIENGMRVSGLLWFQGELE